MRPRFGLDRELVVRYLEHTRASSELVVVRAALAIQLPDPADLKFLEVAVTGLADYLVTGNGKHFVPKRGTHKMQIITPRDLIDLL